MNENEQIADIIRLNDGYVLRMYGQTVACRDEKELGVRVARLAKRGRKQDLGSKSAEPTPIRPNVDVVQVGRASDPQRENIQLGNLYKLIAARLTGEMTEEELLDASYLACPDLDRERVVSTIQEYTERFFGMKPPDPNQESPLGPKCACPECKMNQSVPNHLSMCVSCFAGEHLHPTPGREAPPEGPKVVQAPQPSWDTEEDDENESVQTSGRGEDDERPSEEGDSGAVATGAHAAAPAGGPADRVPG